MKFEEKIELGSTGLKVGRLGIGSGYWAPATAIEEAFECGCNYLTWGTFIKGFSPHMREALRNIRGKGERDRLVLSMFSYAHQSLLTEHFLVKGLKSVGMDYADVLILGFFPKPPSQRIIDGALRLRDKGLIRFIGVSGHNRKLFPQIQNAGIFDVFHVRYNAAHRGAETQIFPMMKKEKRPGIVNFTSTSMGRLLKQKRMPEGERAPTAVECYRFVLSHPSVDVCMSGARTREEMRQNLKILEQEPMKEEELRRMWRIGDSLRGKL